MGMTQEQRDRLKSMAGGSRSGGIGKYFRPRIKNGKTTKFDIRILPAPEGQNFAELGRTHYGPNKTSGTCPKHFGKPCAFCSYFEENFSKHWDKEDGKGPHFESFKTMGGAGRVYFNVLDYETKQVKIWSLPQDTDQSFGSVLLQQIIDLDAANVPVLDANKGRDFKLTLSPRGAAFMYSGDFADRARKIPKAFDGWEDKLHDLAEVPLQKVLTDDEMIAAIKYFESKL